MISRQPVRLSGAGQGFGARRVDYGGIAREKAASVPLAGSKAWRDSRRPAGQDLVPLYRSEPENAEIPHR